MEWHNKLKSSYRIEKKNHLPILLLTFSSWRPKFSPLVSTTSRSTYPQYSARPLCLFPHVTSLLCLCLGGAGNMFSLLHPDVGESGAGRSACGEISLRSCSRQTHGDGGTSHTAHCSGPDRTAGSDAAQSTPDRPGATTSRSRRVPDPQCWTVGGDSSVR